MLGKDFTFDGLAIPWSQAAGIAAGWYGDVKWKAVSVRNFQTPKQDFHGSVSAPTFMEGRLITVSGEIFSPSKTTRGTIRNTLDAIFQVPSFPGVDDDFKVLSFTDDDGTDWFINAKVYTMPEYSNERGDPVITFFIQLFAQDPLVRGVIMESESEDYGLYGGAVLPAVLPGALSGAVNSLLCTNTGSFATATEITVEGEIVNPRILNITNGTYFGLEISMSIGDVLVIDAEASTAKLNGVSVLFNRTPGSSFIFLDSGANTMLLTGDDFDLDDQSKATIKVDWYNTKV